MRAVLTSSLAQQFRSDVRHFCVSRLPVDIRWRVSNGMQLRKHDYVRWQKALATAGWLCGHWPVTHGGLGWSAVQRYIFDEETVRAGAPRLYPFSTACVGPVIYTFGTEAQRKIFLPGILSSETWWCQGYSEPGAGSDLASLSTRAVRDGAHYVVDGQKTWTTKAHWADMMFALVRTSNSGLPQEGISFLLIDMKTPGISVRPIATLDSQEHLNDVFFDRVRVPVENRIGPESGGWVCAKFLLGHERVSAAEIGLAKWRLDRLKEMVQRLTHAGVSPEDHGRWRRMIMELNVQLMTLESVCLDVIESIDSGIAGPSASIIKILGSEFGQSLTRALLSVAGRNGLSLSDEELEAGCSQEAQWSAVMNGIVRDHLHERATTIYGGANEIQRNIIAKRELGL